MRNCVSVLLFSAGLCVFMIDSFIVFPEFHSCSKDSQCLSHACFGGQTHYCDSVLRICSCKDCTDNEDCICPAEQTGHCEYSGYVLPLVPLRRSCRCNPTSTCTKDSHCNCPGGLIARCGLDPAGSSHSCFCEPATNTETTDDVLSILPSSTTLETTTTKAMAMKTGLSHPPLGMRKCHTCGDVNNSISCDTRAIYLDNLQSCARDEDFCMTDIVHDGSASPKTFKRCVAEKECRNKWLHQTSDLEYCINYGSVPMSGQYSCHFCCVSDGCNAGQVPDKSTYYTRA